MNIKAPPRMTPARKTKVARRVRVFFRLALKNLLRDESAYVARPKVNHLRWFT